MTSLQFGCETYIRSFHSTPIIPLFSLLPINTILPMHRKFPFSCSCSWHLSSDKHSTSCSFGNRCIPAPRRTHRTHHLLLASNKKDHPPCTHVRNKRLRWSPERHHQCHVHQRRSHLMLTWMPHRRLLLQTSPTLHSTPRQQTNYIHQSYIRSLEVARPLRKKKTTQNRSREKENTGNVWRTIPPTMFPTRPSQTQKKEKNETEFNRKGKKAHLFHLNAMTLTVTDRSRYH